MDHVFVEETPVAGRERPLTPGATIGREGCDIVLDDPQVSRRHAAMRLVGSTPAIEDLGSSNGTFVNEQRVQGTRPLAPGDTVRFGRVVWRVRQVAAATPAPPAPVAAGGPPNVTRVKPPPTPVAADPPTPVAAAPPTPAAAPPPPPPAPRGDVPPPPEVAPSAVRRVLQVPPPGQAPTFQPMPSARVRGSAATRVEATIVCFVIVAATALALILYFALYEP